MRAVGADRDAASATKTTGVTGRLAATGTRPGAGSVATSTAKTAQLEKDIADKNSEI